MRNWLRGISLNGSKPSQKRTKWRTRANPINTTAGDFNTFSEVNLTPILNFFQPSHIPGGPAVWMSDGLITLRKSTRIDLNEFLTLFSSPSATCSGGFQRGRVGGGVSSGAEIQDPFDFWLGTGQSWICEPAEIFHCSAKRCRMRAFQPP